MSSVWQVLPETGRQELPPFHQDEPAKMLKISKGSKKLQMINSYKSKKVWAYENDANIFFL